MWGVAGGRSKGEQGGERYRRKERKDPEVGVLKGQEAGEIEGNYTPILNILQSKKAGRRKPKKGAKARFERWKVFISNYGYLYNFIDA